MNHWRGPDKAAALAERLRVAIEEIHLKANGHTLRVTACLGVALACWPGTERTAAELIQSADAQLYEAKRAGRNCCRVEQPAQKAA